MKDLTQAQRDLDKQLWWTTVRPWLAAMTSWPAQADTRKEYARHDDNHDDQEPEALAGPGRP